MRTLIRYLDFFNCLVGFFNMIVWTPTILGVLYACVLYVCICPCSAQLSMFHMKRRSRNTLITMMIIIIIIIITIDYHRTRDSLINSFFSAWIRRRASVNRRNLVNMET